MTSSTPQGPARSKIFVVCPRVDGHRLSYARLLLEHADSTGRVGVLVMPTGADATVEYQTHVLAARVQHELALMESFETAALQSFMGAQEGCLFAFPDGDDVVPALASRQLKPGGNRIVVLVMRAKGQKGGPVARFFLSTAKSLLRAAARRNSRAKILTLASAVAPHIGRHEVKDPVQFAPRPGLAQAYRGEWGFNAPSSTVWFGIVGAITKRKNVRGVAEALARVRGRVALVVAGEAEDGEAAVQQWLAPLTGNAIPVVRIAGTLSDDELDSVIDALDIVVVAHSNEGPSGVLGKAYVAGKRVLAAGALSLRADLRRNPDLGIWSTLDVGALASAAESLIDRAPSSAPAVTRNEFAARLLDDESRA